MIELVWIIGIVALVVFLVWTYVLKRPQRTRRSNDRPSKIPGVEPSDPKDGNLADIGKAGSLHEFLLQLHTRFGAIVSFWLGQEKFVSISSPELFKQSGKVFDRPLELFRKFELLWTEHSIVATNGAEARQRRHNIDQAFSHEASLSYWAVFVQNAEELSRHLVKLPPDEHIPLCEHMLSISIKSITRTSFGQIFKDEQEAFKFQKDYEVCWNEIERQICGDEPDEDSPRIKRFNESKKNVHAVVRRAISLRRERHTPDGDTLLIDRLIQHGGTEEEILADGITFLVCGAQTVAFPLVWTIYYLCLHDDVQEKVYKELVEVLRGQNITSDVIPQLQYMRQVIDETLRLAKTAPFTARVHDDDIIMAGHVVPSGTPVVHAIGASFADANLWPDPSRFDPDRFKPETRHQMKHFEPFGVGKRKCPGYRFAYVELTAVLLVLLSKFKFSLVEGQVVTPMFGLVTKPTDEVWVTVKKRPHRIE